MTTQEAKPERASARGLRPFDRLGVFSFLWALQTLAQQLTFHDPGPFEHPMWFVVVIAALLVLWRPTSTPLFAAMLVLNVAISLIHLPYSVNHHLFEDVVNIALLAALLLSRDRQWIFSAVAAPLRFTFLVVYAWAAIAKLNTDFFDPVVSCASFLVEDMLRNEVPEVATTPLTWAAALGTVGAEAGLAILLLIPRTRFLAIPAGLAFHLVLGLGQIHGVQAFSFMAFAIYLFFATDQLSDELGRRLAAARSWVASHLIHLAGVGVVAAAGVGAAWLAQGRPQMHDFGPVRLGLNLAAIVLLAGLLALWLTSLRRVGWRASAEPGVGGGLTPLWLIPALVAANGALPYAGFQTDVVFTMFSNLRVEDGRTNHLFIPESVTIADFQDDPVRLTAVEGDTYDRILGKSWDEVMASDELLTRFEFERLLHEGDNFRVECECYGTKLTVTKTDGKLRGFTADGTYTPWLGRFMAFRTVTDGPHMACTA